MKNSVSNNKPQTSRYNLVELLFPELAAANKAKALKAAKAAPKCTTDGNEREYVSMAGLLSTRLN